MKKILRAVLVLVVAATSFIGFGGCASNKVEPKAGPDPIIQHYVQRRSELVGQRRRLAATYGEGSPQVADIDRQIALVDQAADQRRAQMIEDEKARQQVIEMKREATPAPEGAATQSVHGSFH